MKNGVYEYEIFNHFFGFLILKLVEPQIFRPYRHSFHIFYRLEFMHGPKIVKIVKNSEKKQKPKLFFFLLNLIINVYFFFVE